MSEPLSDTGSVSKSVLASVALLAVRLGCDVVQFRELRYYDGPRSHGYRRNIRAVLGPGQLQQFLQLQPERQSVAARSVAGRTGQSRTLAAGPLVLSKCHFASSVFLPVQHDRAGDGAHGFCRSVGYIRGAVEGLHLALRIVFRG